MAKTKMNNRTTIALLRCGLIGAVLFVVVFLVEGVTRAGYSPMRHVVSLLDLSSQGWQQILNFIVTGLLILLFAQGVRRAIATGPASKWGTRLLSLMGLGLIVSGIFMPDPTLGYPVGTSLLPTESMSWHDTIHGFAGALLWITSLTIASFIFARYFSYVRKRAWQLYSLITGIVVLVSFLITLATSSQTTGFFASNGGFIERIAGITAMLWVALISIYLQRLQAATSRK